MKVLCKFNIELKLGKLRVRHRTTPGIIGHTEERTMLNEILVWYRCQDHFKVFFLEM